MVDSQECINAYHRNGCNKAAAARELGIPTTTFKANLSKAIASGLQPSPQSRIPAGHVLKGVSTLYDDQGNERMSWVKTNMNEEAAKKALLLCIEAMKDEIPRQEKIEPPTMCVKELLSCYCIADFHLGQLSWAEEAGDDWDVKISEELLVRWFSAAISYSPASETAIFANMGDLLHTDSTVPLTPTSGHILDADTRFAKMVQVCIRVIRRVINMLLEKHKHVHVLMAEGNHDISSSIWLRSLLSVLYENEPRVTVDQTAHPYYSYKHGDTSLFFHHGHKRKIKEISRVFAGMFPDVFGSTKYRYAHMGHLHHFDGKEDQLMCVEQHQTLAAKDAHSARGGYISQRGSPVIIYHKKFGETARWTIRPEMVQ